MKLEDLPQIGLTRGEMKLYEALLELGECTRTELVKKSGISASKIYDVASRLMDKGIISSVKKNNVIHFCAANPEKLIHFLEEKERKIESERKIIDGLMPRLMAKYLENSEQVEVEVFYGWDGMRTVLNDVVKSLGKGDYNYIFGANRGYDSEQADIVFSQYYQKKKKKGFGTKIIFNDDLRSNKKRTKIFSVDPNEMRFLDQDSFLEIHLYKNTVLMIMLLKRPIVMRVRSKEASRSFKGFFDILWKQASPPTSR